MKILFVFHHVRHLTKGTSVLHKFYRAIYFLGLLNVSIYATIGKLQINHYTNYLLKQITDKLGTEYYRVATLMIGVWSLVHLMAFQLFKTKMYSL